MVEIYQLCKHAVLILRDYMCIAKTCPYGNQSRATSDFEGEGALPFCLSKGLEKRIENENIKKLARDYQKV